MENHTHILSWFYHWWKHLCRDKNYYTEPVQAKIDYFPKNLIYKIIYKQEMKQYLTYCIEKYSRKFYEVLYEK